MRTAELLPLCVPSTVVVSPGKGRSAALNYPGRVPPSLAEPSALPLWVHSRVRRGQRSTVEAHFPEAPLTPFPSGSPRLCQPPRATFPRASGWTSLAEPEVDLIGRSLGANLGCPWQPEEITAFGTFLKKAGTSEADVRSCSSA